MDTPAIVVVAYNRLHSLQRLLQSLLNATYGNSKVPLVICIDKSETTAVTEYAEAFNWPHGDKEIIAQPVNLGLKEHILQCGGLTARFGSIILLEDDLLVSPAFYQYARRALQYYNSDEAIAGISLYSYQVAENGFFPFYPYHDGSDVYFMQLPSSWGEVFTAAGWSRFTHWYTENRHQLPFNALPAYIRQWSAHSWKKIFAAYMMQAGKYFVYPRQSYSTNYGDPGINTDRQALYQVPLQINDTPVSFKTLPQSPAVYDAWFEISADALKKIVPSLNNHNFAVDLHGTKAPDIIDTPFLLSSKKCSAPVISFGNGLADPLQSVVLNEQGNFYALGKTTDFSGAAPDVSAFYPSLNSIRDIVFNGYVQATLTAERGQLSQQHQFQLQYPSLFIGIVYTHSGQQLKETLESIYRQAYPPGQLNIKIFGSSQLDTPAELQPNVQYIRFKDEPAFLSALYRHIDESGAQYYNILQAGDTYYDQALDAVNKIFRRYIDMAWLTGIETIRSAAGFNVVYGNTATRRWNEHIFNGHIYRHTNRYIPPAATFWKRFAWDTAKANLHFVNQARFYNDIWAALFKVHKLYTCNIYLSSSPYYNVPGIVQAKTGIRHALVETGLRDKLQEFFFLSNVPFLRAYYKVRHNLPEVIRLEHETQWYFQSDF